MMMYAPEKDPGRGMAIAGNITSFLSPAPLTAGLVLDTLHGNHITNNAPDFISLGISTSFLLMGTALINLTASRQRHSLYSRVRQNLLNEKMDQRHVSLGAAGTALTLAAGAVDATVSHNPLLGLTLAGAGGVAVVLSTRLTNKIRHLYS